MRILRVVVIIAAALLAAGFIFGQEKPPMKADAAFIQSYEQMRVLDSLIADTERELGAYRQRQQLKISELRQWMKEHGVDGYQYDADKKEFVPVPKPVQQPAKKP